MADNNLALDYVHWIDDNISVYRMDGYYLVDMPYLDAHNDIIQLYVTRTPDGLVRVDDGGECLGDLCYTDAEHIAHDARLRAMVRAANTLAVAIDGRTLVVYTSQTGVPEALHRVACAYCALQAIGYGMC